MSQPVTAGPPPDSLPLSAQQKLFKWVPALDSLRGYTGRLLQRDLFAGLTVAAVAVPQAMAYASIFGVPVEYGLYTAIVMTAIGALFDSSKQLINGPTNAISIALLSALSGVPAEVRIDAAILMATMIGVIQIGITLCRLGDLSRYISHAVIVGFTLGASALLLLDQVKNLLGFTSLGDPHDHFIWRLWLTWSQGTVHLPTLTVSAATIVTVVILRWVNRRYRAGLPELLLAIVILSAVTAWLPFAGFKAVALIPPIPRSLPSFSLPKWNWSLVHDLSGSALAIGLLGLLEAIAMAKSLASKTRQKLDINQQCLSEGLANFTGSFFQCFPGSGSLTRSYINHQAGAATQWSGVISAAAVALTILALAPFAEYIPRPALAAILVMSAWRMVDRHQLKYHLQATRFDAMIVAATALSAVLVSIEFCILIGVFLSFLFYVPRAAQVHCTELTITPERTVRDRVSDDPRCDRLLVFNLEGELFFGSAPDFEKILDGVETTATESTRIVLLRVKHVRNPDAVCLHLLDHFLARMQTRNIRVALCGVRDDLLKVFDNVDIPKRIGREHIFPESTQVWTSTMQAIQWAYRLLGEDLCDKCPRRGDPMVDTSDWFYVI
ncbi:MAG: SulP family inorganic anion transporter [Planctomycetota bacterium]|nr:SulP family inorganic anion transporter [Planctomycetota bacterium]